MSDMHNDEWRLVTFSERITAMLRVVSMSMRQLWPLIIIVLVISIVVGWLFGAFETYVNDGSTYWSKFSTLLKIVSAVWLMVFSFGMCLSIAIIAYHTIMQHGVPTWREAFREGFDHLESVMWVALIYLLIVATSVVGSLIVLTIVDTATNGFEDTSLIVSVVLIATLIGFVIIDGYAGFYWLAVIGQQRRGLDALHYSYHIVKGRWGWVLLNKIGVMVVLCLISLVGIGIVAIGGLILYAIPADAVTFDSVNIVLFGLLNLIAVITGSAYMTFLAVLYKSLRHASAQHTAPIPTV